MPLMHQEESGASTTRHSDATDALAATGVQTMDSGHAWIQRHSLFGGYACTEHVANELCKERGGSILPQTAAEKKRNAAWRRRAKAPPSSARSHARRITVTCDVDLQRAGRVRAFRPWVRAPGTDFCALSSSVSTCRCALSSCARRGTGDSASPAASRQLAEQLLHAASATVSAVSLSRRLGACACSFACNVSTRCSAPSRADSTGLPRSVRLAGKVAASRTAGLAFTWCRCSTLATDAPRRCVSSFRESLQF